MAHTRVHINPRYSIRPRNAVEILNFDFQRVEIDGRSFITSDNYNVSHSRRFSHCLGFLWLGEEAESVNLFHLSRRFFRSMLGFDRENFHGGNLFSFFFLNSSPLARGGDQRVGKLRDSSRRNDFSIMPVCPQSFSGLRDTDARLSR